jgi:hypothetical protein
MNIMVQRRLLFLATFLMLPYHNLTFRISIFPFNLLPFLIVVKRHRFGTFMFFVVLFEFWVTFSLLCLHFGTKLLEPETLHACNIDHLFILVDEGDLWIVFLGIILVEQSKVRVKLIVIYHGRYFFTLIILWFFNPLKLRQIIILFNYNTDIVVVTFQL